MNPELNPESYLTLNFFNLFQQEQKLILVVPNKFVGSSKQVHGRII